MDTNKMRDDLPSLVKQSIESHPGYGEFAAWCESEQIHPYPIYFLIWQASREAVVVELPVHFKTMAGDVMWSADVREALEAHGLKCEVNL